MAEWMRTIAIIGAGPAGMTAALKAAGHDRRVLLFDSNDQVGRKLLLSGGGRCNITNRHLTAEKYTCADHKALAKSLAIFGYKELIAFLLHLAIPVYATEDGWCYPFSQSAKAVVDTLATALSLAGVEFYPGHKIVDFRKIGDRFELDSAEGQFHAAKVIVAAGGVAYPKSGSCGECFPILRRFGHTIIPHRPALAPVIANVKTLHKLQGVRLDAKVRLYFKEKMLAETFGNLLITQWGLNGPGVMNLSHFIDPSHSDGYYFLINFIPYRESILRKLLAERKGSNWPLRVVLQAVLPFKAPPVFMAAANMSVQLLMKEVSDGQLKVLFDRLTSYKISITATKGFDLAQSSAGGVPFTEVDPITMQSKKVSGLFLAGETLDVVGPCGGYNLQFAFTSGALAGMAAAKSLF